MKWARGAGILGTGTMLAVTAAIVATGVASAAPAGHASGTATPPFVVRVIGRMANGQPMLSASSPTGLPPSAIASVYKLSGLSPSSGAGSGQIIAIVDAYNDPHALSDLNHFNAQYGYAKLSACSSLTQSGPCFDVAYAQGSKPRNDGGWALEESLDIEWAHAEAPAAKIVLVEAADSRIGKLFGAVTFANKLGATEVSMSWGGIESNGETSFDADMKHSGTFYTASSGDTGHGADYPAASPNVIAVGGTTLHGCSGTTCSFTKETAWSGSGGGASGVEPLPGYQARYTGKVSGASTIKALTGGRRGIPDVSFDANPRSGVSVFDSTKFRGQSGWFTLGGTSVGAPNWAGILAAGAAAKATALQGHSAIYSGGYTTNLRDITSGRNGSCGTGCNAGTGYDLVTGLGSPISYP